VEHRAIIPESAQPQSLGQQKRKLSRGTIKQRAQYHLWRVTAYAADGVIEALEHEHHLGDRCSVASGTLTNDPLQQRLFQALVEAARVRKLATPNLLQRLRN